MPSRITCAEDENLATGPTFNVNDSTDWREDLRSFITSIVQSKKKKCDPEESEEDRSHTGFPEFDGLCYFTWTGTGL